LQQGCNVAEIFPDIERPQIGRRFAGVERVFVELKPFAVRSTEHHRANSTVAERKRIGPFLGRLVVPE
jgi:hypothetical protein